MDYLVTARKEGGKITAQWRKVGGKIIGEGERERGKRWEEEREGSGSARICREVSPSSQRCAWSCCLDWK